MRRPISILLIFLFFAGCLNNTPGKIQEKEIPVGQLEFVSSDSALERTFRWAKKQAIAYVFENDPVGNWYEAALPGREAFCIRDVSHQAVGAHALGLQRHTENMLKKFAASISEAKDWCAYWEINRYNKPAPVDYRNDKEFWYNLPANFDLLSACYRMYLWSRDPVYLRDSTFVKFYRHTVSDYVQRWDLSLNKIQTRKRFMNRKNYNPDDPYQYCRGIPSYHEGQPGETRLGIDLLAFQAAAYNSYANILGQQNKSADAELFAQKSDSVQTFIRQHFWDGTGHKFYDLLLTDGTYTSGGNMSIYLLYTGVLQDADQITSVLQVMQGNAPTGIEIRSHYPEIFYRYGAHDSAYRTLLQLSAPGTKRREYPEVSFAVIGAMVTGLMGIEPAEEPNSIGTLSRLTDQTKTAEMTSLPFGDFIIDVRHRGRNETVLTNHGERPLVWFARFYGKAERLSVSGKIVAAKQGTGPAGIPFCWLKTGVAPGCSVAVKKEEE